MNIVFITINDQHFLTGFFKNFLSKANPDDSFKVLLVQPLYKNETILSMAIRYLKTFGMKEFLFFSGETVYRKLLGTLAKSDKNLYSVKAIFEAHGHEVVCTDRDVNDSSNLELLRSWNTDIIVSVGCPQIFKKDIINLPHKGCLNLHGAPLPRYRGVLPSFWMLKHKENYAANTLFFVNELIDGGDIILQESFPIESNETLRSLILKSKLKASEMVLKAIQMIKNGNFLTRPIEVGEGSYFRWPSRNDVLEFFAQGSKLR
jgi:methionyl-tRNA formyltransferase